MVEVKRELGPFKITSQFGYSNLDWTNVITGKVSRIGTIINNKTPEERHGGIEGWLDYVRKRSETRMVKIEKQLGELEREWQELNDLVLAVDVEVDRNS